ncbi:putative Cytochrome P450 [Seiridium cardinale]|uniref:Cytochrome P450 n=1 Tax=Seiridium cardinale TaxID=138064 RepID=A0ABR2Y941_9PEZI
MVHAEHSFPKDACSYTNDINEGDIVRIAPNDLSFVTPQSFRDIYSQPTKGRKLFNKTQYFYKGIGEPGLNLIVDPAKHAEQRKRLAPGFSARALRDQEDLIHHYTDRFIELLDRSRYQSDGSINMVEAIGWLTFDIAGELAFGESFDAVKNGKTHFWSSVVLSATYFQLLPALLYRIPILWIALPLIFLNGKAAMFKRHSELTLAKTRKRVALGNTTNRHDFFAHLLKDNDLSEDQLAAHASLFIVAGAETTATAMSGAVCFLAQNPACLQKLQEEVRGTFKNQDEITGDSAAKLPYLNAVIEESLRYCPPVSIGLPRDSPGEFVDGEYIPKGTVVSTDYFLMAHDSRNFDEPYAFKPERWLEKKNPVTESLRGFDFTIGPRSCLGITLAYLEMRIVMAKLVFAFDWELVNPQIDLIRDSSVYLLWDRPELKVKFQLRSV